MTKVTDLLDRAHTLLAKSSLPPSQYNPISELLIQAKAELMAEVLKQPLEPTRSVADFANRIATVLYENQSSAALFFVQQAYEDDGDGLEGLQQSSVELLKTVIANSKLLMQQREIDGAEVLKQEKPK